MITITLPAWIAYCIIAALWILAFSVCLFVAMCAWEYIVPRFKEWKVDRRNKKLLPVAWGLHDFIQAVESDAPDDEREKLYRRMRDAYGRSCFGFETNNGFRKRKGQE